MLNDLDICLCQVKKMYFLALSGNLEKCFVNVSENGDKCLGNHVEKQYYMTNQKYMVAW